MLPLSLFKYSKLWNKYFKTIGVRINFDNLIIKSVHPLCKHFESWLISPIVVYSCQFGLFIQSIYTLIEKICPQGFWKYSFGHQSELFYSGKTNKVVYAYSDHENVYFYIQVYSQTISCQLQSQNLQIGS